MLSHHGPIRPADRWEYDVTTSAAPLTREELNERGRDGWLLTSVEGPTATSDGSRVYYWRRVVRGPVAECRITPGRTESCRTQH